MPGQSAGGSRNDLDYFSTNPQYVLTLNEPGKLLLSVISIGFFSI